MKDLPAHFPLILEDASAWVAGQEATILAIGTPLTAGQLEDARQMGVEHPERIRVLVAGAIPCPVDGMLGAANRELQFITNDTAGLTLRYGIYIRSDFATNRRLLLHELVHVGQYERLGGITPFLRAYLTQCLQLGYRNAPLELEAHQR